MRESKPHAIRLADHLYNITDSHLIHEKYSPGWVHMHSYTLNKTFSHIFNDVFLGTSKHELEVVNS